MSTIRIILTGLYAGTMVLAFAIILAASIVQLQGTACEDYNCTMQSSLP